MSLAVEKLNIANLNIGHPRCFSRVEKDIPIILVYGDSDDVVPYDENGALLEKYYRENGGTIITIGKPGCAHHPHGLEDPTPIITFVESHL